MEHQEMTNEDVANFGTDLNRLTIRFKAHPDELTDNNKAALKYYAELLNILAA